MQLCHILNRHHDYDLFQNIFIHKWTLEYEVDKYGFPAVLSKKSDALFGVFYV